MSTIVDTKFSWLGLHYHHREAAHDDMPPLSATHRLTVVVGRRQHVYEYPSLAITQDFQRVWSDLGWESTISDLRPRLEAPTTNG